MQYLLAKTGKQTHAATYGLPRCLSKLFLSNRLVNNTNLRKLLRSPCIMYSNIIIYDSSSIQTPWNFTIFLWSILVNTSASLSKSFIESSVISVLSIFIATITFSPSLGIFSHLPRYTLPKAPSPSCSIRLINSGRMCFIAEKKYFQVSSSFRPQWSWESYMAWYEYMANNDYPKPIEVIFRRLCLVYIFAFTSI